MDLDVEFRHGTLIRTMIEQGLVNAVHDLSDGGLAVALAEMAIAGNLGAELQDFAPDIPSHALWFGEDQARYLVTTDGKTAAQIEHYLNAAGVPAQFIGIVGGEALHLPGEAPIPVAACARRARAGCRPIWARRRNDPVRMA